MSRTIDLPGDVHAALEGEANNAGVSVAEWIAALAARSTARASRNGTGEQQAVNGNGKPRTLADEFAGRVGLISSGRGDLAQRASELFANGMVEKRRLGQL